VSDLEELAGLLSGGSRVIVISDREVNLKDMAVPNRLFLLRMAEGSLAAGGRGGGFGERRVVKVSMFSCDSSGCKKVFETSDEAKVQLFEVPYHVARIPMTLSDGTEGMGYGVAEPEMVQNFLKIAGVPSSP